MNVELHIERLVLDGLNVEPRDRHELRAALESELTRLLATSGLRLEFLSGGALRAVNAGVIQVPMLPTGLELGNQIAHAVHGGIGAGAASPPAHSSSNPIGTGNTLP